MVRLFDESIHSFILIRSFLLPPHCLHTAGDCVAARGCRRCARWCVASSGCEDAPRSMESVDAVGRLRLSTPPSVRPAAPRRRLGVCLSPLRPPLSTRAALFRPYTDYDDDAATAASISRRPYLLIPFLSRLLRRRRRHEHQHHHRYTQTSALQYTDLYSLIIYS